MPSSEILRCVALVITDVSEELTASIIRVTITGEHPTPSTEAWNLTLYSGYSQTHATTCYPHYSLHPESGISY
jgi:hypothetical protein